MNWISIPANCQILSGLSQFSSLKITKSQDVLSSEILYEKNIIKTTCKYKNSVSLAFERHQMLHCNWALHFGCPNFGFQNVGRYDRSMNTVYTTCAFDCSKSHCA